jgi:hypothetical protein
MSETESSSSDYEKTEAARDIAAEKSKQNLYDELTETEQSPFYNVREPDIFMMAMSYGRQKGGRAELQGERYYPTSVYQLSEKQEWIIKAVAVREERTTDVLKDERLVFRIAQEYANTGIEKLHNRVFGPEDDPLSELTNEVVGLHQENGE